MSVEEFGLFDVTSFVEDLDTAIKKGNFAPRHTQSEYESEIIARVDNRQEYYERSFLMFHFREKPDEPVEHAAQYLIDGFAIWKQKYIAISDDEQNNILNGVTLKSLAARAATELDRWSILLKDPNEKNNANILETQTNVDYWSKIVEITSEAHQIST